MLNLMRKSLIKQSIALDPRPIMQVTHRGATLGMNTQANLFATLIKHPIWTITNLD